MKNGERPTVAIRFAISLEHTVRNNVVESSLSLPVMATITLVLWLSASTREETASWLSLAVLAVTAYAIVEWNNQCQLLRVRSRMNSVTYLALVCLFPALHTAGTALIPALCLVGTYFMLFKACGEYKPQGYAFHGFFFLGIGSLFFPPMLLLAPVLFFACNTQLRILTLKTMSALVLGLILPFWLYAAFMGVAVPLYDVKETRLEYLDFHIPAYAEVPLWQWAALAFVGALGIFAVVHFVTTSYNDKIRTRQFFFTMLTGLFPLLLCALWWTDDFTITLPLLLVGITPFVAHFMALSKSNLSDYIFWGWIVLAFVFGIANYFNMWEEVPTKDDLLELLKYIPL